ncbi:hypothetical protein Tco_1013928 [Tanacetum coccineum]
MADDETQGIVTNNPKRLRKKRKATDGASGSGLPPKKLREDNSVFGDAGANTAGKSLTVPQGLLDRITLAATHAADDEVTSIVRSSMPPLFVLTADVATTIIVYVTFAPVPRVGTGKVPPTLHGFIFLDDKLHFVEEPVEIVGREVKRLKRSRIPLVKVRWNSKRGPEFTWEREDQFKKKYPHLFTKTTPSSSAALSSMPPLFVLTAAVATTIIVYVTSAPIPRVGTGKVPPKLSTDSFFESQDVDSDSLYQIYIPKWNVTNDSALDDPDICHNELRGRKKFGDKCVMQAGWLKERDVEIPSLKAQLSLKEAEATEVIRLRGQVAIVEAAETTRASELNGLKEQNVVLEGQVATLESAALSCDELSIKASSLESDKDKLIDQVSQLEGTCSRLRDEVMGYKLFKEQIEAVQDMQVKVLSDRVAELDANLMGMALHLDEEFYPGYLTTIVGRRWILSRGLKLVVMKCLQSPEYLATQGGAISRAIDKGIQVGLDAGIDHEKAERDLTDLAAYDPSIKANYIFAVSALRAMNFPLLAQLESHKDASIADLMGLLHLEGPAAETLKGIQLQPSPEQLMLPIHCLEDQVLSNSNAFIPLIEMLSTENLVGEASTFEVPVTATTTALSTTFIQASTIPSVPVTDHEVLDVGPSTKVSSPPSNCFLERDVGDYAKAWCVRLSLVFVVVIPFFYAVACDLFVADVYTKTI